jgi:hypothetical protein
MKKILLTTSIIAASSITQAANFDMIAYESQPSQYVGRTDSGIAIVSNQLGSSNPIYLSLIDTITDPDTGSLIATSESTLAEILPWPNGYQEGLLANYPNMPENPDRFEHLGITTQTTTSEFIGIADSLIEMLRMKSRGGQYLYKNITGYTAVGVAGNYALIADHDRFGTGNIYHCDFSKWNIQLSFQANLQLCSDLGNSEYIEDIESGVLTPTYKFPMNSSGYALLRKRYSDTDGSHMELMVSAPGKPSISLLKDEVDTSYSNLLITDGESPIIAVDDKNDRRRYFSYENGAVSEIALDASYIPENGTPIDGDIIESIDNVLYMKKSDGHYKCTRQDFRNSDMTFEEFLQRYSMESDSVGEFLSSYPDKPARYEELIIEMNVQELFPSGITDAEFQNLILTQLTPEYEHFISDNTHYLSCASGTESFITSTQNFFPARSTNGTYEYAIRSFEYEKFGASYIVITRTSNNSEIAESVSRLILDALLDSAYRTYILESTERAKSLYPELFLNYPDMPQDLAGAGLPEDTSLVEFQSLTSNIILNTLPFGPVKQGIFLQPLLGFTADSTGGFSSFNGIYTTGLTQAEGVIITVNPENSTIDPYLNAYSSLTIGIQGQAYATEVSCSVDTTALNITGSNYGDWGGENRLTLPLNWGSQNMSGAITHTGNAELEENGTLLSADLFADTTTTTANVVCSAALSDASGNLIPVTVQNATITIDDGIHGGNGGFSGSIEIPVGVNPEDITVSVTINGRTITTGVDSAGNFSFDELRDGDFTIAFNADNYVQSCMNHSISEGANIDVGQITLFAGDINDDGEINIADFTYLAGKYGSANGDELYDQKADLNKDSVINVQDLAILASHFGSVQCNPQ